jgi:hypothetical protein
MLKLISIRKNRSKLQKPNLEEMKLKFTNVVNLEGVKKAILQPKEDEDEVDENLDETFNTETMHKKMKPQWQISLEDAKSYQDVLVQHLGKWMMKNMKMKLII